MSPRQRLKFAFFSAARLGGANWAVRRSLRRRLTVLGYHGVVPDDCLPDRLRVREAVTRSQFRQQMEIVARCFHPVSGQQVVDAIQDRQPLPDFPLLVTFDDGFRNNLTCAAEELRCLDIPAVFLIATGYVGRRQLLWPHEIDERLLRRRRQQVPMPTTDQPANVPADAARRMELADQIRNTCKRIADADRRAYLDQLRDEPLATDEPWCDDLYRFLDWDEIRQLANQGFEIGAHTVNHPILSRLPPARMLEEIRDSKSEIERQLDRPCRFFAYPNGGPEDVNGDVIAAARQAGITVALTLTGQPNRLPLQPLAVDRMCVVRDLTPNLFHAHVSGLVAALRRRGGGTATAGAPGVDGSVATSPCQPTASR